MKRAIIRTKDLCKSYQSEQEIFHAIKNVNLEIYEDEFTVIMGSSGSGKSTLLYLLSGLDELTAGKVYFDELEVNLLKEKKMAVFRRSSIGFVFQAIHLVPNLSIYENVLLSGYLRDNKKQAVEKRANDLLEMMGISEQSLRLPAQVSGGQQQRAAIARALINQPQVLFADEPTGALNSLQGQNVLDILTRINQDRQTIVMVTHDIQAAVRADRILFITDGRIDSELRLDKYTPETMKEREKIVFDYLTRKGW